MATFFVPGHVDAEQARAEYGPLLAKLKGRLLALQYWQPFFAIPGFEIRVIIDPTIPTWAVDENGVVRVNPKFTLALTDEEVMFCWFHEILHPALHHFQRRGHRDHRLSNLAADRGINIIGQKMGLRLIRGALLPLQPAHEGMTFEELYEEECKSKSENQSDKHTAPGQGCGIQPPPSDPSDGDPSEGDGDPSEGGDGDGDPSDDGEGGGAGEGEGEGEGGGEGEGEGGGEDGDGDGGGAGGGAGKGKGKGKGKPGANGQGEVTIDSPYGPMTPIDGDRPLPASKAEAHEQWQEWVAKGRALQASAGTGTGNYILGLTEPQPALVPWRALLQSQIAQAIRSQGVDDVSWRRLDRRSYLPTAPCLLPGRVGFRVSVACTIDASGSMGQADVVQACHEVASVAREAGVDNVYLVVHETAVSHASWLRKGETGAQVAGKVKGGGGTDFGPAYAAVETAPQAQRGFDLHIHLTDGEPCGPWPAWPRNAKRNVVALLGCATRRSIPAGAIVVEVKL